MVKQTQENLDKLMQEKAHLEVDNLKAQLRTHNTPLWLRPAVIIPLIGLLITVAGLYIEIDKYQASKAQKDKGIVQQNNNITPKRETFVKKKFETGNPPKPLQTRKEELAKFKKKMDNLLDSGVAPVMLNKQPENKAQTND